MFWDAWPLEAKLTALGLLVTTLGGLAAAWIQRNRHRYGTVPRLRVEAVRGVILDPDAPSELFVQTLNITVTNHSGAPVEVTAVSVSTPDGRALLLHRNFTGKHPPVRLGQHESFSFVQPIKALQEGWQLKGFMVPMKTRVIVHNNMGKAAKSKRMKLEHWADVPG